MVKAAQHKDIASAVDMVDEQQPAIITPEEMQKIVASSSIINILLKSSESQAFVYPGVIDPTKCKVDTSFVTRFEKSPDDKALFAYVDYDLASVPVESEEGKDSQRLFQIKATFVAVYLLPVSEFRPEAIEAFVSVNAAFHTYPYFREFAQSTTGRLGVPSVVIPLLKIPPAADQK
jgi:hypothetical protein